MNIRTQLTLLGAGSILATVAMLTGLGIWQSAVFHAGAKREVDRLVGAELRRTTRSAYDLVRSQDQSLTTQIAHAERMARYLVRQQGGLTLAPDAVRWTAVNQFTHTPRSLVLPRMQVGGRWLGQNKDPKRGTPVVDEIRSLTGADATIFQRIDAQGDLLRVATTIRALNGQRAAGTFIPAVNPDGHPNSVVASLLQGKVYRGNAFVVSAWYVSEYTPLLDRRHQVIGAIYTGLKQEQVAALRQTILQTRVGTTGTIRVLCGTGVQKGWYRIPPPGGRSGQSMFEARDGQGQLYIQTILARAMALPAGQSTQIRYLAPSSPDSAGEWHVAQITYYKPWDWVIVADTRADDFKGFEERLSVGRSRMALTFLVFGSLLAGVGGWFLWRVACRIARAAGEVALGADRLANGTLAEFSRAIQALGSGTLEEARPFIQAVPVPVRTRDEIGAMATSFNAMLARTAEAVAGLNEARQRLWQARNELVTLNSELEHRVEERTAALRETEERTRLAIEAAHLGTWEIELETGMGTHSASGWRMLGLPESLLESGGTITAWSKTIHPEDCDRVKSLLEASQTAGTDYTAEYRVLWPDGSVHWIISKGQVLKDSGSRLGRLLGVCRDITHEKELEASQERLLARTAQLLAEALERADRDPLTGLWNHRAFQKRLEEEAGRAQRTGQPLTIAVLDLDNFKFFNDAYGHLAGDEVLRCVAAALSAECRSYDTLARFGGDEFALLLPGLPLEEAALLAPRLRAALATLGFRPPGYDTVIPIGLSVGTAVFPEEAAVRHEAVELADARLRRAKTGGGDAEDFVVPLVARLTSYQDGFSMLSALVTAVDNKDRYTRRHSEDVLRYSLQIAQELGLGDAVQEAVQVAALLHDVGKIGVPDAILRKPGQLSDEDFKAIQQHPLMGAIIVAAVPGFEETLDAVRHHHERWDGGGYPFGLQGTEIPLMARLMAVADAYSAMTTDRPYRKGMDTDRALSILEDGAGIQWDPACVAAFQRARQSTPAAKADAA